MISLKCASFVLLMAIAMSLTSKTQFINPMLPFLRSFKKCEYVTVSRHHHHHHHNHHDNGRHGGHSATVDICEDFPPDFPPPDSNSTSILCVDWKGCCNFTTVQAAVDAAPVLSQKRIIVWINSGMYNEKVMVPRNKPNITFQGQGYVNTAIMWNDTANSSHGTFYSGSVQVFSSNFIAKNISFINVAPMPGPGIVGAQAVAIRIGGDMAAFWGCGFFGAQDTLHDDRGRHYFKDCYIQGSIDFVFGNGRSFYENCALTSIASPVQPGQRFINGAVTASGRASADENSGFVFYKCSIGGTGRIWLGRAWRAYSRVIYAYTSMTDVISPDGWNDLGNVTSDQSVYYGEYMCTGAGANMSTRVSYEQRLNDTLVAPFLNVSYIDADQWTFCCTNCRISVSSTAAAEGHDSSRPNHTKSISTLAHYLVQERLDQMIKQSQDEEARRLKEARKRKQKIVDRHDSSRVISRKRLVLVVAMEKCSNDPRQDFRRSMVEVILGNKLKEAKDLRYLLKYYISVNYEEYKGVILEAFYQVSTQDEI
ncbi:hypothetical protein RND81_10G006000 [Saponaria officinalis]|uniref:Pectinesterase n=1 Tax=Saponaria officinalis TaxID=3572 RepID=A0AAW1HXC8_SAPOF